ncbi:MAG: hypothetical protein RLZZ200_1997 [Pseudomonadota bacterium]
MPVSAPPQVRTVTLHYLRATAAYDGWGLHLWGDGIAASAATSWNSPRTFDRIENGVAVFVVPVADPAKSVNFILHNGDLKSPVADQSFVPQTFGYDAWIVQDSVASPFATESAARAALAQLGNASSALDLTPIAALPKGSGLPADWTSHANVIEIYVRGYQDSDGDGVGDLQGLISRLDYLKQQGFTALWLMPVFRSADHDHGYAVEDYRAIEPDYGTLADFDQLLAAAHSRGMAVILDYVMNHAASTNPLFLDASAGVSNARREWFVWRDSHPSGWSGFGGDPWHNNGNGWYYGVFATNMPDFNLHNPDVVAFHKNNLRFWLNRGVDGFRFDAVTVLFEDDASIWQNAPGNHPLLNAMAAVIGSYPNRLMVCEAPGAEAAYSATTSCGRAFGFQAVAPLYASVQSGVVDPNLDTFLRDPLADRMPLLLGNHDSFVGDRVWNRLNGDQQSYRLLASTYLLGAATPFTYYGEEIGIANGSSLSGDAALRVPMSWTADSLAAGFSTTKPFRRLAGNSTQQNVADELGDSQSLLRVYRSLLQLRNTYPVIGRGDISLQSTAGEPTLRLTRQDASFCAAIAINYSQSRRSVTEQTHCPGATFNAALGDSGSTSANSGGVVGFTVPARSAVVLIAPRGM